MDSWLGLRRAWSRTKGARLTYRIAELIWEIRYAWQRAWRGYDHTDIVNLGAHIASKMPVLLREFKEHNISLFPNLDGDRLSLTEEETNAIIDDMIFYFENCDEDFVYRRLFGVDSWKEDYDSEKWNKVGVELQRCRAEALRLFSKWCWCLWY